MPAVLRCHNTGRTDGMSGGESNGFVEEREIERPEMN